MSISYSGLVTYGKSTLPSVESWGNNMNIMRDPPRSVHTRKKDKVGETSFITQKLADSGDRFCEAINYYARGQNPMVAVSYGEGSTGNGNTPAAFLPYRVMRDGAFRPPILRAEDVLPLSRLPRQWTNLATQPYLPIFTKRIFNCGTAETTKEVKNNLLTANCEAAKSVCYYPSLNAPSNKSLLIRDPLVPGEVRTNFSSAVGEDKEQRLTPRLLAPNRPVAQGSTNLKGMKERPIVFNRVFLDNNRPNAVGYTNFAGGYGHKRVDGSEYTRLTPKCTPDGYEGRAGIPAVYLNHPSKDLVRVR